MSRDKGNRAAKWVATWLRGWWPTAEATPNGRRGVDIENTPGVAWEIKTGVQWRAEWLEQAQRNGELEGGLPVVCYLPPGCGEANVANALAIMPMHILMQLLKEAQYVD